MLPPPTLKAFELLTSELDMAPFVYVDFLRFCDFLDGMLILLFYIMPPRGFDPPPFLVV